MELKNFMNLKESQFFLLSNHASERLIPKACTRRSTKRGIGIIFFRADNYAVAKEILVNKYCTKVS